ncbi:hypothetical protein ACFE04_011402 [Oxalis oulophora]
MKLNLFSSGLTSPIDGDQSLTMSAKALPRWLTEVNFEMDCRSRDATKDVVTKRKSEPRMPRQTRDRGGRDRRVTLNAKTGPQCQGCRDQGMPKRTRDDEVEEVILEVKDRSQEIDIELEEKSQPRRESHMPSKSLLAPDRHDQT